MYSLQGNPRRPSHCKNSLSILRQGKTPTTNEKKQHVNIQPVQKVSNLLNYNSWTEWTHVLVEMRNSQNSFPENPGSLHIIEEFHDK